MAFTHKSSMTMNEAEGIFFIYVFNYRNSKFEIRFIIRTVEIVSGHFIFYFSLIRLFLEIDTRYKESGWKSRSIRDQMW